ncbi:Lrp/AsnC family transcriptional regulator [Candidatus Woesearchaeota archaeon]|nr:Lrp/AsnC family transcriptional regulator [Candidatus Woesearchaeota archaeon]
MQQKIISGFRMKLNIEKLGLQWYLLMVKLAAQPPEKMTKMMAYLKEQESVYYVTSTVGDYDLMIDAQVRNFTEIRDFIVDLTNHHPVIKTVDIILISKEHKINYLPKLTFSSQPTQAPLPR